MHTKQIMSGFSITEKELHLKKKERETQRERWLRCFIRLGSDDLLNHDYGMSALVAHE